jgi:hypothetical protein
MNPKHVVMGVAAGAAVLAVIYAKNKLPGVARDAVNAVSPFNPNNIFYGGVNNAGASLTGDPSWNLGARLWEMFNPDQVAAERAMLNGAAPADPVYGMRRLDDVSPFMF